MRSIMVYWCIFLWCHGLCKLQWLRILMCDENRSCHCSLPCHRFRFVMTDYARSGRELWSLIQSPVDSHLFAHMFNHLLGHFSCLGTCQTCLEFTDCLPPQASNRACPVGGWPTGKSCLSVPASAQMATRGRWVAWGWKETSVFGSWFSSPLSSVADCCCSHYTWC